MLAIIAPFAVSFAQSVPEHEHLFKCLVVLSLDQVVGQLTDLLQMRHQVFIGDCGQLFQALASKCLAVFVIDGGRLE